MDQSVYKTVSSPRYLTEKIRVNDSISILRTNTNNITNALNYFNAQNRSYYIYFLDGDEWGKRDAWVNKQYTERYDFETSYQLFEIAPYKDSIAQWQDEFLIISPHDLTTQIDGILASKDFTMTRLAYCTTNGTMETVAKLSRLVKEKKKIQKGISYVVDELELRNFDPNK